MREWEVGDREMRTVRESGGQVADRGRQRDGTGDIKGARLRERGGQTDRKGKGS